jgi:transposase-like protein
MVGAASLSIQFCDGLSGVHIIVCPGSLMEEQHFRCFSCGTDFLAEAISAQEHLSYLSRQ